MQIPSKPLVLLPACERWLDGKPMQTVRQQYLDALQAVGLRQWGQVLPFAPCATFLCQWGQVLPFAPCATFGTAAPLGLSLMSPGESEPCGQIRWGGAKGKT
jgi:hypothetical protein